MKKIKVYVIVAVVAMATVSFLFANHSSSRYVSSMTISNIEALNASAGEMWCDPPTDVDCKITTAEGDVGESKGVLRMIFEGR